MTIASLLVVPGTKRGQNAFAFDHQVEHRRMNAAVNLANPSYIIDPALIRLQTRARKWNLDHQTMHNAFVKSVQQTNPNYPASHNMMDSDLTQRGSLTWWTFLNLQEHRLANRTILAAGG